MLSDILQQLAYASKYVYTMTRAYTVPDCGKLLNSWGDMFNISVPGISLSNLS